MPNPNHLPPGNEHGGEFAPKSGSNATKWAAKTAAGTMTDIDRYQERIERRYPDVDLPTKRPDGAAITLTPDRDSERRGLTIGSYVRGNYSPIGDGAKTVRGYVIGFAWNRKNHPGGSSGDVVVFDKDAGMVYFIASRNVFKQQRPK